MVQAELFDGKWATRFAEWIETPYGGRVADRFIRLAIGLRRRGFQRCGAKMIVERIRWTETILRGPESEKDYKVNNNYTAYLARLAERRVPELRGFFQMRETGSRDFIQECA